jgi:hypothetical protein
MEPATTLFDALPRQLGETLGTISGWVVAPLFAVVSFARRARTFHPSGSTLHATVYRHARAPVDLHELADRLVGHALVRFSGALWKYAERFPDVLGCAIRFRHDPRDDAAPQRGDQDLLLATIRRPWTMAGAPLTTQLKDYLNNDYFGVSPFDIGGERRVYFRMHPRGPAEHGRGTRNERLATEVDQRATLSLECSPKPYGPWQPIVEVLLERPAALDGDALHFSPFRTGRGVQPRGFVHAMRRRVYEASQAARSAATRSAREVGHGR